MFHPTLKVFLFKKSKQISPIGFMVLAACNGGGSSTVYVDADTSISDSVTTAGSVVEGDVGDPTVSVTGVLSLFANSAPTFLNVLSTAGDNGYGNFLLTDGVWIYTLDQTQVQDLDQNDQIEDSITFLATDGSTQKIDIVVSGTNDTPSLETAVTDKSSSIGSTFSFDVNSGFFNDLDADDTLTFSATQADGTPLPDWLSLNSTTGVFSGTSQVEDVGAVSIRVTATDDRNTSASDLFTLTITSSNFVPTLEKSILDQVIAEDSALSFQFSDDIFSDSDDGDNLSFRATLSDGSALPAWLNFNGATRTFSGTPVNDNVGSLDIKVIATDY